MKFVEAITAAFETHSVRRKCWPKEIWVTTKSTGAAPTLIMFFYSDEPGSSDVEIQWQPSLDDVFAEDWEK